MIEFQFHLVSSLYKVLPHQEPAPWVQPALTLLRGEHRAFQLAFFCRSGAVGGGDPSFTVSVTSPLADCLSCHQVCLVPCDYPCHDLHDDDYLTTAPGLLPDLLRPICLDRPIRAVFGQWRALWFTVDAAAAAPGTYELRLEVTGSDGNAVAWNLPVTIRQEALPPQTLYHTEWFHGDCLADYYQVPVFSAQHWGILDAFLAAAARCGVNMILTPVFTPPLDTAKGGERTTIQLVEVFYENGAYRFDFAKLRRWIGLCRAHGITELEISHLFTQWGAIAAPKVMVWENGVLTHRFGWHTPAVGGEYTVFLRAFLPALKKELQEQDMWEHTWFHISDEPNDDNKASYLAAKNSVRDLLEGRPILDALSSFAIYQDGIVEKPAVCEDHLQPFLQAQVPGLWTYYCTGQAVDVPNRFMAMPSARNRILGVLLYVHQLEGFLHWGFNFYNSFCSVTHIDPFRVTDAGESFPSGDAFLVYPAPDGTAWPSIRSEILSEAMEDLRFLQLAEKTLGRDSVAAMVTEAAGSPLQFDSYPKDPRFFNRLRRDILTALDSHAAERRNTQ